MNPDLSTRKLAMVDILGHAWSIYRKHFVAVALVVLCASAPAIAVRTVFGPNGAAAAGRGIESVSPGGSIGTLLVFATGLIAAVGGMAVALLVEDSLDGKPVVWHEALMHAVSRLPELIVTVVLMSIIVALLSLAFVVPGVIWAVYYAFAIYVVGVRDVGGKAALDYSKDLVKGKWWRVFGYGLVVGAGSLALQAVIARSVGIVESGVLGGVVADALATVVTAYLTVAFIVLFLNTDYLRHPGAHGELERRLRGD